MTVKDYKNLAIPKEIFNELDFLKKVSLSNTWPDFFEKEILPMVRINVAHEVKTFLMPWMISVLSAGKWNLVDAREGIEAFIRDIQTGQVTKYLDLPSDLGVNPATED